MFDYGLPVNVDILLLVTLPPQPLTFHVGVGVGFVQPAGDHVNEWLRQRVHQIEASSHAVFKSTTLVPVEILQQSLNCCSFRVSDLLNKTHVAPRENLGSKIKISLVCSSV